MSYRIIHAFKQFAVTAVLRLMPTARFALAEPEPVRQPAVPTGRDMADHWMFDNPVNAVAPQTHALSSELSRMSGALTSLRGMLAELAELAPIESDGEVNEIVPANFSWQEDILFDGDTTGEAVVASMSIKGEADFLFEEEPAPRRWAVLEPSLIHASPAA